MSAAPETVAENELAFFLVTNEPVPARPLLNFLYEVERRALLKRNFGPSTTVEIIEIKTGTKLVRISFTSAIALASLAVAVAAFANDLVSGVQQPSGRLAETMAAMCLDHGVVECVVTTSEGQVRISREQMPAVGVIADRRERSEAIKIDASHSDGSLFSDRTGYAQGVNDAVSSARIYPELETVRSEGARLRKGRIYTVVGTLTPPAPNASSTEAGYWNFISQSGRSYWAQGIDVSRVGLVERGTVVVRAELAGHKAGLPLLEVKDVFTSDEP